MYIPDLFFSLAFLTLLKPCQAEVLSAHTRISWCGSYRIVSHSCPFHYSTVPLNLDARKELDHQASRINQILVLHGGVSSIHWLNMKEFEVK